MQVGSNTGVQEEASSNITLEHYLGFALFSYLSKELLVGESAF